MARPAVWSCGLLITLIGYALAFLGSVRINHLSCPVNQIVLVVVVVRRWRWIEVGVIAARFSVVWSVRKIDHRK